MDYKQKINEIVFLVPTGNYKLPSGSGEKFVKAIVTKVTKIKVTLALLKRDGETAGVNKVCRIHNNLKRSVVTVDNANGGYLVFPSEEAVNQYHEAHRVRSMLHDSIRSLTDEQLMAVKTALEW
jgi:hypothetical protein